MECLRAAPAPKTDLFEAVVEDVDGSALEMPCDLFHIIPLFPGKRQRYLILRAGHRTPSLPTIRLDGVPLTVEGGGSGESPC